MWMVCLEIQKQYFCSIPQPVYVVWFWCPRHLTYTASVMTPLDLRLEPAPLLRIHFHAAFYFVLLHNRRQKKEPREANSARFLSFVKWWGIWAFIAVKCYSCRKLEVDRLSMKSSLMRESFKKVKVGHTSNRIWGFCKSHLFPVSKCPPRQISGQTVKQF